MRQWHVRRLGVVVFGLLVGACASNQSNTADTRARQAGTRSMNSLTAEERAAGWKLLFDGHNADQWRVYQSQSGSAGWSSKDGALIKNGPTDDIITREQFGDFELAFDWKLSPGGNAGVFYRGTEEYEKIYWTAPEYQLLDDSQHDDGQNRLTSAGAAYGLYPAPAGVVRPGGEWNSSRIVVNGPHVEHWLNGAKLLEYELWSADWEARVKASKFVEWPKYGRARRGHIAIQGDHEGDLALRNIRIRE
ncbi:MAG: DUF1080 domain-containing protein [Gemmatimonadaceae bacterium]